MILQKVRDHLCNSSLISKLEAKHDLLKVAIQKGRIMFPIYTEIVVKRRPLIFVLFCYQLKVLM